jgi:putative FmdB family regulatory protein
MPTYQYVCSKCGHEFEVFQSMMDKPLSVCPKELCVRKPWGKGKLKRLIGAGAGIIFKGSGFYITDYRSQSYKDAAKKDTAAPSSSGGESKPAAASSSTGGAGSAKAGKTESKPAKT